jgi:hypothetical protein
MSLWRDVILLAVVVLILNAHNPLVHAVDSEDK